MAIANRISEVIPATVIADVTTKITDARNLLKPYLLTALEASDIEGLAKLGEQSEPFASKGIDYAKTNAALVPSWVNIAEAEKDKGVFDDLRQVDTLMAQFAREIHFTRIEAGAEVLDAVNDFYKSVKTAHLDGVAAATPIFIEMKKRYESIAAGKAKSLKEEAKKKAGQ
jgi:hypothetical protein